LHLSAALWDVPYHRNKRNPCFEEEDVFRKSTIGLASLAVALSAGLAVTNATAATRGMSTPAASVESDQKWCAQQGGNAVDYSPWYNTNSPEPTPLGGRASMCTFANTDGTKILVAASTLAADKPSMAALAYTYKPAASEKPPADDSDPSSWYCSRIGGTESFGDRPADVGGWAPSDEKAPKDFISLCVFADRSMIDSWGLMYHTHGVIRGADLTGKWKATIPTR
jgi:putative hemolysin